MFWQICKIFRLNFLLSRVFCVESSSFQFIAFFEMRNTSSSLAARTLRTSSPLARWRRKNYFTRKAAKIFPGKWFSSTRRARVKMRKVNNETISCFKKVSFAFHTCFSMYFSCIISTLPFSPQNVSPHNFIIFLFFLSSYQPKKKLKELGNAKSFHDLSFLLLFFG